MVRSVPTVYSAPALLLALAASRCSADEALPARRLPALEVAVFACSPNPSHVLVESREGLERTLDALAPHCPAETFRARREALLRSLERSPVRWEEEALVVVQDWYGTGMATATLGLDSPSPGLVRATVRWEVPPPPVTPDTAVRRFAFAVRKGIVTRVEVSGHDPRAVSLDVPGGDAAPLPSPVARNPKGT